MCIAILNNPKTILTKKSLQNCWENNGDGAGMLYVSGGKLKTVKELDSFKVFWKKYSDAKKQNKSSYFVLHFRISTHGKINETNCHPFLVNHKIGFVHNGIIGGLPDSTDFSDTYMFNQTVLKGLPEGFEHNEAIKEMMRYYIDSSKLIFLNVKNEWSIVGESLGHWDGDNWYSNSSYKAVSKYVDFGGTKLLKGDYRNAQQDTYKDGLKWDELYLSNGFASDGHGCSVRHKDDDITHTCAYCMDINTKYNAKWNDYLCPKCTQENLIWEDDNRHLDF